MKNIKLGNSISNIFSREQKKMIGSLSAINSRSNIRYQMESKFSSLHNTLMVSGAGGIYVYMSTSSLREDS